MKFVEIGHVERTVRGALHRNEARLPKGRVGGVRPVPDARGRGGGRRCAGQAQALRHEFHERLMRAFLEPEVFDGGVRVTETPREAQLTLD